MYGRNTVRLCAAEMKAAVEHYFRQVVFQGGAMQDTYVTDITEVEAPTGKAFDVLLESPAEGPKPGPP